MAFAFPAAQWRLIRTTNGLERLNQEVRRRTRVARVFPNEASCLRLVTAVVMEISEEWETGKAYLLNKPGRWCTGTLPGTFLSGSVSILL
jgi:transposase-like protein